MVLSRSCLVGPVLVFPQMSSRSPTPPRYDVLHEVFHKVKTKGEGLHSVPSEITICHPSSTPPRHDVLHDAFHKVKTKGGGLHSAPSVITICHPSLTQMRRRFFSQVVFKEEGAQKKEMMLRAPEAVPKICALPPDTHIRHKKKW